jgi:hypothetical protein
VKVLSTITHALMMGSQEEPGLFINSMQSAMGRETFRLRSKGVASGEDIGVGIITKYGLRMPEQPIGTMGRREAFQVAVEFAGGSGQLCQ